MRIQSSQTPSTQGSPPSFPKPQDALQAANAPIPSPVEESKPAVQPLSPETLASAALLAPKASDLRAVASSLAYASLGPPETQEDVEKLDKFEKFLERFLKWERMWLLSQATCVAITRALFTPSLFADPRSDASKDAAGWPLRKMKPPMESLKTPANHAPDV